MFSIKTINTWAFGNKVKVRSQESLYKELNLNCELIPDGEVRWQEARQGRVANSSLVPAADGIWRRVPGERAPLLPLLLRRGCRDWPRVGQLGKRVLRVDNKHAQKTGGHFTRGGGREPSRRGHHGENRQAVRGGQEALLRVQDLLQGQGQGVVLSYELTHCHESAVFCCISDDCSSLLRDDDFLLFFTFHFLSNLDNLKFQMPKLSFHVY